ncbi:hypothetical protein NDU88_004779 [Pleurodeles waltl]|uniref:Uncharacterized protein n=1 Tax=Pleurodeles waltl TaxID=8319 RepID=A0AAV7RMG9_PLEWA|nr:hypothetical protein NDU88_004779 [Pleurodeles waltl]
MNGLQKALEDRGWVASPSWDPGRKRKAGDTEDRSRDASLSWDPRRKRKAGDTAVCSGERSTLGVPPGTVRNRSLSTRTPHLRAARSVRGIFTQASDFTLELKQNVNTNNKPNTSDTR